MSDPLEPVPSPEETAPLPARVSEPATSPADPPAEPPPPPPDPRPEAEPKYPVTPPPPPAGDVYVHPGERPWPLIFLILLCIAGGVGAILLLPKPVKPTVTALVSTTADLVPVHARVFVGGEPVRELRRLAVGDVVSTDAGGRARLRLDAGTSLVLDGETKLSLTEEGLRLDQGRVFVLVSPSKTVIDVGSGSVAIVESAVGIERRERTRAYVASGEVTARSAGREMVVKTGETADFTKELAVAPERGFDDWTGGLAAPWATSGSKRGVAEVWGRSKPGEVGSPLTIRAQDIRATLHDEVAETKVSTTFFNAGQESVVADFRLGLPSLAIVSDFFVTRPGAAPVAGQLALASRAGEARFESIGKSTGGDILEWAGDGWVRGTLPSVGPGQTVTVTIGYVEWLPVRKKGADAHVVQYRYPLAGEGTAPLVGELSIRVDAGPSKATQLAAGMGAKVKGDTVELRRSDFRASSDFVVDAEMPVPLAAARAYVAEDPTGADEEATLVVRTEAPRLGQKNDDGITVSLVLDTSASIDPALLDAGRAFVEAVVKSLSDADRIVVLASDTTTRPLGPAEMGPADAARKASILQALAAVERGGATDLGRALEGGADAIPADVAGGMVVYVGDGWGSVGDRSADAIRARLARRKAGAPRIGAVLVGPSSNRRTFAELTRGSGPLVEVGDSEDAAQASVSLLEKAIVPTVTGVSADLGPDVSRLYPRAEIAAPQGSSVMFVGRLSGPLPKKIKVTHREGEQTVVEELPITVVTSDRPDDVRRRWADARARAMALSGRGREAVTNAALGAGLLTPWTAWTTRPASSATGLEYGGTALSTRVLELSGDGSGFGMGVVASDAPSLSLASPVESVLEAPTSGIEDALFLAAVRTIEENKGSLRQCRDTRAALRPDLPGAVQIRLKVNGDGKASDVVIENAQDPTLATCLTTVVANLAYPRVATDVEVSVSHTITWPPVESLRGKKCSPASTLAVPLRRGVWRERIDRAGAAAAYLEARRSCELASWTAKRAFLELALVTFQERSAVSAQALAFAKELEQAADPEAVAFLKREALRRATPAELRGVRQALLAQERLPWGEFVSRYEKASDDRGRLAVVNAFLGLAPHDPRLRTRLLALFAALGEKESLVAEVRRLLSDPFVDAVQIADGAHWLRTIGLEADARRAYGEIAERATSDPWAHALLGDRLRAEGWFDDATAVYEALDDLVPFDAATQIRLALAHLGGRRVDAALRILDRVARTGGREAEPQLAELADRTAQVFAREVLADKALPAADRARLERALAEMPALPAGTPFLIESPAGFDPVTSHIERGPEEAREIVRPRAVASKLGLVALDLEPSAPGAATHVVLSLGRPKALAPSPSFVVRIHALEKGKLVTTRLELPNDGSRIELDYDAGSFGAPRPSKVEPASTEPLPTQTPEKGKPVTKPGKDKDKDAKTKPGKPAAPGRPTAKP